MSRYRLISSLLLVAVLLPLVGCGDSKEEKKESVSKQSRPTQELVVAASDKPNTLDPLATDTNDGLELTRQIYEPLTAPLIYQGGHRKARGLALSQKAESGFKDWIVKLRPGVKFQDGSKLDAAAVVKNVNRWLTSDLAKQHLGTLRGAETTGTYSLKLKFTQPVRDISKILASPRLGIVSARALSTPSGRESKLVTNFNSGSGPFVLESNDPGNSTVLNANPKWWGKKADAQLHLAKVVFNWISSERDRIALVRNGKSQIATSITYTGEQLLHSDPNITLIGEQPGRVFAVVRWLRGLQLSPTGAESFESVWISQAK